MCVRCGGGESCHRILSSEVFSFTVVPLLAFSFFLVILIVMSMQSSKSYFKLRPSSGNPVLQFFYCCSFNVMKNTLRVCF